MKYSSMYKRLACAGVLLVAAQPLAAIQSSAIQSGPESPGIIEDIAHASAEILLSPFKALTGQITYESTLYSKQPITCMLLCISASAFSYWGYKKFVSWFWGRERRAKKTIEVISQQPEGG